MGDEGVLLGPNCANRGAGHGDGEVGVIVLHERGESEQVHGAPLR